MSVADPEKVMVVPALYMVPAVGSTMLGTGGVLVVTKRVAGLLVTDPEALEMTTRKISPLSASWALLRV